MYFVRKTKDLRILWIELELKAESFRFCTVGVRKAKTAAHSTILRYPEDYCPCKLTDAGQSAANPGGNLG
jgi:hypothetical protein